MNARCTILAIVAAVAGLGLGTLNAQTNPIVKIAIPTLNDGQHDWIKRVAAGIEKRSNGRMRGELYPASQLGSIPRMIEGTQLGSIQIFSAPPEFLVGVDKRFELLSAPGLVTGEQQAINLIADPEFSKAFLALGANKGLVGLCLFIAGPAAYATRMPFRTLADISGKKIRILASPFQADQVTRLGATAVPMSLGDVLPALQQGTIDGSLSTVGVLTSFKYYETAKYLNETGQAFVWAFAVASKRWFDGLPPDLQAIVLSAAREAAAEENPWVVDFQAKQRKAWVENGGVLNVLSSTDKAEMVAKVGSVGDDIVKTQPELKPLWDLIRAAARRSQ